MHVCIFGQTGSGKSTLAKRLAGQYLAAGHPVLLLDPTQDPDFPATLKTSNPDTFLRAFWKSRNCMVFIEEAGDTVGRYPDEMRKTATLGRHVGHLCHYIAQRATTIDRTVRDQCSEIYLFHSSLYDSETSARDWNCPALEHANQLQQGEYYHFRRFGQLKKGFIFNQKSD